MVGEAGRAARIARIARIADTRREATPLLAVGHVSRSCRRGTCYCSTQTSAAGCKTGSDPTHRIAGIRVRRLSLTGRKADRFPLEAG
jgi:hypothetical protein